MHLFSYPTDSHYSQTSVLPVAALLLFSYPTDSHHSQTPNLDKSLTMSLVTLQIHTTLKHQDRVCPCLARLVTLQIHTTLKQAESCT